ncbi:hypothetical protein AOL_s00170g12 [Orbilia oligospora ATCC 24927]|uniref:SCP domain-containing protein n=1 Tax=Arthrobotrys oligospora (strain ATCC 24927 / CBS 115.81 / DSM 1491) TaxID=756982 RepID=G1XNF9_ARTOA|nr:hypothetical protein AOL_s00170g12 [Orbilia oligospora ATCC 24927]EGX45305.1 hypothetical protein AOL_s00170g12 [Orbilia oligospora ATCC 24927]
MKLSYTALVALLLTTALSSPTGHGDSDKGKDIAVTLDAVARIEDAELDLGALQNVHGKNFEAGADTRLDIGLEGRSVGFDATEEIDKRGTKFIISTVGTSLRSEMLKYHNAWRAHHGAPALKWNTTLAMAALKSARKCVFAHTKNNEYGENIAAGTYTSPSYYASLPGFSSETGHFTAVVWKNTKQIGCAYVKNCAGGLPNMLFCEYSPAGNVLPASNFRTNVLPARTSPKNPAQPSPNL